MHVIDAYQLIDNAVANPAAYGLTNVTSPVWSGNFTSSSSGTLAATSAAAQDQYLFWDHLHPTETGHQAIAEVAEEQLSGTPRPGRRGYHDGPASDGIGATLHWTRQRSAAAIHQHHHR